MASRASKWDSATGLEYLRARYYSAAQARFTTRDGWAGDPTSPMSYNAWNYTNGNPVNATDPTGQQQCTPEGICPPPPHPTPPLPPKTPTVPDWTAELPKYLQTTIEERKIYQALKDPTLITAFDITRGQYEKRDALLEIWFESHCDYDPLYDYAIEEWFAGQGWDPYALKLYIGTRWGWWKYKRNPGDLAGIQGIVAGVAFVGAQDEANKLGNLGVQMPWTKVTKANGFAAWTKELEGRMRTNRTLTLTKEQADIVVSAARKYGVQYEVQPGHPNTDWDGTHLHIGDQRYHIRVPDRYILPP